MNKFEKLETSIFNMASLVNVLDNKSREKNIFINNVREQQFENSGPLIAIVKNIDKNVMVTRAYRAGEQSGNLQKNRPIITSLLDKQQPFSVVRHEDRLKYTDYKIVYITEDLCQEWRNSHYIMKKCKRSYVADCSLYCEMFISEAKCWSSEAQSTWVRVL